MTAAGERSTREFLDDINRMEPADLLDFASGLLRQGGPEHVKLVLHAISVAELKLKLPTGRPA